MSEFIKVETSKLQRAALDWAVARAEGVEVAIICPAVVDENNQPALLLNKTKWLAGLDTARLWEPSTNWSQGGTMIERNMRASGVYCDGLWQHIGTFKCSFEDGGSVSEGETALIAACRAVVALKLGHAVSVPAELVT